ncbi:MAG: hypothetical protein MJZ73_03350 [Bacteroidaceae bacterium]|nr:hypothetical protein [Bacteroidaceae bacterium]
MAYQDALSLYNSGKVEDAFEELKKCSPSPMVDGLKKECERLIEEQFRYLISEALRENPYSTNASVLYNQYVQKYGHNERLKELVPIPVPPTVKSPDIELYSEDKSKKGFILGSLIVAFFLILGVFIYKNIKQDNANNVEWKSLEENVVESGTENLKKENALSANNLKDVSVVYEFDLPDGRHRTIFCGSEPDENGSKFLYAATHKGKGDPQIKKIAIKYDRYNDGYDFFSEGFMEYPRYILLPNNNIYLLTRIFANSGWQTEFQLYLLDCKTLKSEFIVDCAAARGTDDGGVTVAIAKLTNEDTASYSAEQIWLMHDLHYNNSGNPISVGDKDYSYSDMIKMYGENLIKGFTP